MRQQVKAELLCSEYVERGFDYVAEVEIEQSCYPIFAMNGHIYACPATTAAILLLIAILQLLHNLSANAAPFNLKNLRTMSRTSGVQNKIVCNLGDEHNDEMSYRR